MFFLFIYLFIFKQKHHPLSWLDRQVVVVVIRTIQVLQSLILLFFFFPPCETVWRDEGVTIFEQNIFFFFKWMGNLAEEARVTRLDRGLVLQ